MNTVNRNRARWHLNKLGWRVTTSSRLNQAIRDFQAGYTRTRLVVDGIVGPATMAAILQSSRYRTTGGGTLSTHFDWFEFACKCGGRYSSCARIKVDRDLVLGLEKLRTKGYPRGLTVFSGYRCPSHNRAVGGATASQHLTGRAADIPSILNPTTVRSVGAFTGLGRTARTNTIAHVDVRAAANPASPVTWDYN